MIKEIDNAKVKERLIELKLKSNLKSEEISQQANVAIGTVNDHFNKNKPAKDIKSDILYKYSRLFGVTVDYLLSGEGEKEEKLKDSPKEIKVIDAIVTLMEIYGVSCFDSHQEETYVAEYDRTYHVPNVDIQITNNNYVSDLVDKIKPIVTLKDTLENCGVYEIALNKVIDEFLFANIFDVYGNTSYDDFSPIE